MITVVCYDAVMMVMPFRFCRSCAGVPGVSSSTFCLYGFTQTLDVFGTSFGFLKGKKLSVWGVKLKMNIRSDRKKLIRRREKIKDHENDHRGGRALIFSSFSVWFHSTFSNDKQTSNKQRAHKCLVWLDWRAENVRRCRMKNVTCASLQSDILPTVFSWIKH